MGEGKGEGNENSMRTKIISFLLATLLLVSIHLAEAQQPESPADRSSHHQSESGQADWSDDSAKRAGAGGPGDPMTEESKLANFQNRGVSRRAE